ncbi:MAG: radical SAM protein [Clostridia bacterium]|nr:radical SAM protein [Clostridia bacterium]
MICTLCPRMCRAERNEERGEGFCRMGTDAVVARAAPHLWEEPCISGTKGSGTVFFSGCSLGCAYCQNHSISHERQGRPVTDEELAQLIRGLEEKGAHNISFVTGTHFIPAILAALKLYRPRVPVVWNTGGYETVQTLRLLEGTVDIYLPDLKHVSPRLGKVLCDAPDYFEFASAAVLEMLRQTGCPVYDENGIMRRGTVIRHLVLPGCTGDSLKVLDWIAEHVPDGTPVSIMRQYTPIAECRIRGMDRRVTDAEYDRVADHALVLGLNALTQEKESAQESYIPNFDMR